MASTIKSDNGVSSGVTGIVQTADSSGQLAFQTTTSGGSAVTALTLNNSQQATFANTINVPNTFGFKNRIINGAMVIDQRNNGASLAITTNPQYSVDRWCGNVWSSATGRFSLQQSSTAPTGFTNSLLATVTTADSSPSTNYGYSLIQYIEGFNTSDLGFGTANAKTVTLSFWVQSSVTGNFPFILYNYTTSRAYGALYTISSANTWTQISITITGDTTGTWSATNSGSFVVCFGFGGGSGRTTSTGWQNITGNVQNVTGATSLIATNGATFYITGVQLEVGTQATSFDYRPYGTELALCQRYFYLAQSASGRWNGSTSGRNTMAIPAMRTTPSVALQGTVFQENYASTDATLTGVALSNSTVGPNGIAINASFSAASGSPVAGYGTYIFTTSSTSGIACSAEL